MSRLKGADAGVPSAALNYRGEWSATPSPAYAANDLVTRNGSVYVASTAPAANDPAAAVLSSIGATPSAGATAVTAANAAASFTVSAPVLVYAMKWYSTAASSGGRDVGISTDHTATPTFIAKGSSHAGVVGWDTVTFAAPVLLVPGTTYYAVVMTETTVGKNGLAGGTYGVITVPNGVWQGASLGISASPAELVFELDDLYWRPVGPSAGLLARKSYNPATLAILAAVGSATAPHPYSDLDATNLAVTFVAPASGTVLVRLSGFAPSMSVHCAWAIREGTTLIATGDMGNDSSPTQKSIEFLVSGLTPGSSHTYKWGASAADASSHNILLVGGDPATQTLGNFVGAANMEVWAA